MNEINGQAAQTPTWRRVLSSLFRHDRLSYRFWEELEEALIMADAGTESTIHLIERTRQVLADANHSSEMYSNGAAVRSALRQEIEKELELTSGFSWPAEGEKAVIMLIGVNGSGKTTTAAKLGRLALSSNLTPILAAADTFRAGAIEQLQRWGDRLGVRVVAHQAGGDPGAVVYDAISAVDSSDADVLIVDTAGRMHNRHNLMEELAKLRRILESKARTFRRTTLLTIDASTGRNALSQARSFLETASCDGAILTKMDGMAKGGSAISVAIELRMPILFVGYGESLDAFGRFSAKRFAEDLLPDIG